MQMDPDGDVGEDRKGSHSGKRIGRDKHVYGDEVHGDKISGDKVARDKITIYQGAAFPRLNYRDDIAHILDFYTKVFIGRTAEGEHIVAFAAQEPPGYLLVEAPAGFGKTALIAHLIHPLDGGQWEGSPEPALLYFFIRWEGGQNTAAKFLQAINSQLLTLLNLEGGVPSDPDSLHNQFNKLWSQAIDTTTPKKPLLLLVDGLDEMASGVASIASELPTRLGPYVHVVVTSRPNPEPLRQVALEHPFRQSEVLCLQALSIIEISDLLVTYGAEPEEARDLAPQVWTITKGEPLFARFVSQEVANPDEREAALERLKREPPKDVADYFRQQLDHLKTRASGQLTRQILGLLLVTRGSITGSEIAEVLDKDIWEVEEAIQPVQRFLIGRERFELMHVELRQAVTKLFHRREISQFERAILAWCQKYQTANWPGDTPAYILDYYAGHLHTIGQRKALYDLINRQWLNVKFTCTHSHHAFAEDVLLVVNLAKEEEPLNWLQFIRGCLLYATLGSLASNIPPKALAVLAQLGQVDRAMGYAALVADPRQKAESYLHIAYQLMSTDLQSAKQALIQALITAESIMDESCKAGVLHQIIEVMVRAKSVNKAIATAENIPYERDKEEAFGQIARVMAQMEDFDRAEKIAANIGDEGVKVGVLTEMARAMAQTGEGMKATTVIAQAIVTATSIGDDCEQASALCQIAEAIAEADIHGAVPGFNFVIAMAEGILDESQKVEVLSRTARAMARAGEVIKAAAVFDQAITTAESIVNERQRAEVLSGIARAMAQAGEVVKAATVFGQAITTAESIESLAEDVAGEREWALGQIAEAMAQVGDFNRAMTVVENIRNADLLKAQTLCQIAEAMAQAGDFDQAVAIAENLLYGWRKAEVLGQIASAMAQIGAFDQAMAMAKNIGDESQKVEALSQIAKAMVQAGDFNRAVTLIDQVVAMAESIPYEWGKAEALSQIVGSMTQVGNFDQAVTIAKGIPDEWGKAKALGQIAIAMTQTDGFDQLVVMAESIGDEENKAEVLIQIARAMVKTGERTRVSTIFDQVVATTKCIGDERGKAEALGQIAGMMADARLFDRAVAVAESIGDEGNKAEALGQIAGAMVQVGDFDKAVVTATSIPYHWGRAETLSQIAEAMAEAEAFDQAQALAAALSMIVWEKTEVLSQIAGAIARAGDFDKAVTIAESIEDEQHEAEAWNKFVGAKVQVHRVRALSQIAGTMAQVGESVRSTTLFDQAITVAESIGDEENKAEALSQIARAMTQAGESIRTIALFDQAIVTAESIPYEQKRAVALSQLVKTMIQARVFDRVLVTAESIPDEWYKAEALSQIAGAMAQAGDFDQAMATAMCIEHEEAKAEALRQIINSIIQVTERNDGIYTLCQAFEVAYQSGRHSIWSVLSSGTPLLAAIDTGWTLQKIYEAIIEIESWWYHNQTDFS